MKNKLKSIYLIFFIILVIFFSCNKKKNELYSISISPNTMVGTPAEMFSLQQIKMFQASNNFIANLTTDIAKDTLINNYAIAPMYLINNLMLDSTLISWQHAFMNSYNITTLSQELMQQTINSFSSTVKEIDSTINIQSNIEIQNDSCINIAQKFHIKIMYSDAEPNDIDNIFTTIDNTKPRLDFITINDNINTLINDNEQIVELPIGNGNYMLMLIKPLGKSIKEYMRDFSEEKYFSIIKNSQQRKISLSFPLIQITDTVFNIPMPQYKIKDSLISFPKRINIISDFTLEKASQADLSSDMSSDMQNNILQKSKSTPIKYNSPFIFIIRGKNSNLIMYMGAYCKANKNKTI